MIMAPILPHLAEEIHDIRRVGGDSVTSVFERGWSNVVGGWLRKLV